MKKLLATALCALCVACASPQSQQSTATGANDPLATLRTFTLSDLQNASALGKNGNDRLGPPCYDYLTQELQALGSSPAPKVSGAVSAFELARLGYKGVASGASDEFQLACAPLLSDVQANVARLTAIAAGTAAGVTVAPGVLPVLP